MLHFERRPDSGGLRFGFQARSSTVAVASFGRAGIINARAANSSLPLRWIFITNYGLAVTVRQF